MTPSDLRSATGWRAATSTALYGTDGFFRHAAPADHFRASTHVDDAFAAALLRLAAEHQLTTIVDVGAGGGELLRTLHRLDPALRLIGVEVAERPANLPPPVQWCATMPDEVAGLVVANEWLDNVPVDVAEVDESGHPRLVLVDPATGAECLGAPTRDRDQAWLARWWPLADTAPGCRAEIGWPRDDAWAGTVRRLRYGLAVAIDYAHLASTRPADGCLTGYRNGHQVPPAPDGSCDITAHVALDACAAAGVNAGADDTHLLTQRAALRTLGVRATRPPRQLAHDDPAAYLAALSGAGSRGELTASGGLGDHQWLLQARGIGIGRLKRQNG